MTDEKQSSIKYFDREALEIIHKIVSERWAQEGEPIPPFSTANYDRFSRRPLGRNSNERLANQYRKDYLVKVEIIIGNLKQ